jgi:hypothetical protein
VSSFNGKVLVLPDVRIVNDAESKSIHQFSDQGGSLVMTGQPDAKLNDLSKAHLYPDSPERAYLKSAEADFDHADPALAADLMRILRVPSGVEVSASRNVVAHVATIGRRRYIFLANFDGLKAGPIATPRTQRDIEIKVDALTGSQLHILPFLGTESVVTSKPEGSGAEFTLPAVERGAVAWID